MSTVSQTAGECVQSVAQPELSYNYARVLTTDRGLRRVLDMLFEDIVLKSMGEQPEEGTPQPPDPAATKNLEQPAEGTPSKGDDSNSPSPEDSAGVLDRVAVIEQATTDEAKEQKGASNITVHGKADEAKEQKAASKAAPTEDVQTVPEAQEGSEAQT